MDDALREHVVRLDRHRLAQCVSPLLARLEIAVRAGDQNEAHRLIDETRRLLAWY